jgi:hypothetical protein
VLSVRNPSDHAVGIRIVRVVDELDAVDYFGLNTAASQFGLVQSIRDVRWRDALTPAHARGKRGIADHVLTEDGKTRFDFFTAEIEREGRARCVSAKIGGRNIATTDTGGGNRGLAVAGDEFAVLVVRIEHDDAAAFHLGGQCGLLPGNRILSDHVLDVGHADIGEDGGVRISDVGEHLDLTWMIHAHLGDAALITLAQRQQRERQADVVVQIAESGAGLAFAGHDDGSKILGRSFAIAAGQTDDQRAVMLAITTRHVLQGNQGVPHLDHSAGQRSPGWIDLADNDCRSA